MTTITRQPPARPGHAILFATSVPLLLGALLSDWAYSSTYVIQWANFAAWLNAGAMVIIGLALAWALVGLVGSAFGRSRARLIYVALLAAVFALGFINALVHARDAWAAMPAGLILSIIVFLLALVTAWLGLHANGRGDAR